MEIHFTPFALLHACTAWMLQYPGQLGRNTIFYIFPQGLFVFYSMLLPVECGLTVWEEKEACMFQGAQADTSPLSISSSSKCHAFPVSAETGPSARDLLCPQAAHPWGLAPQSAWLCIWLKLCSPFILPSSFTVLVCSQPALPTLTINSCN